MLPERTIAMHNFLSSDTLPSFDLIEDHGSDSAARDHAFGAYDRDAQFSLARHFSPLGSVNRHVGRNRSNFHGSRRVRRRLGEDATLVLSRICATKLRNVPVRVWRVRSVARSLARARVRDCSRGHVREARKRRINRRLFAGIGFTPLTVADERKGRCR